MYLSHGVQSQTCGFLDLAKRAGSRDSRGTPLVENSLLALSSKVLIWDTEHIMYIMVKINFEKQIQYSAV